MESRDKALLSQEQRALYEAYAQLFASPGWRLFYDRFVAVRDQYQLAYRTCSGAQRLGQLQGLIEAYDTLLVHAPQMIENEFTNLVQPLGLAPEPEAPLGPQDWRG